MNKYPAKILIADDDEFVLLSLKLFLEQHFTEIKTVTAPQHILSILEREQVDIVLLDMNFGNGDTSGNEGLFWMRKILSPYPNISVVLITAFAEIQIAVSAIKEGAFDFIAKPWQNEKLLTTVIAAYQLSKEKRKVNQLKSQQKAFNASINDQYDEIIGESLIMQEIKKKIQKVAATDADVLILGPNGTGKEVVARKIHQQSQRSDNVFIAIDVGSLSESLFESELFGHKKGAFTDAKENRIGRIEAASGGTLFLDEIGNLSLPMQAKLLTLLQNKSIVRIGTNEPVNVDIRIISATNVNLEKMVTEGKFREDLLYRINTIELNLPPLNYRQDDIRLLANHFLKKFSKKYQKPYLSLTQPITDYLMKYQWPGNVRELQHAIERAVIMCDNQVLETGDFGLFDNKSSENFLFNHLHLEKLEEWAIRKAIAKHQGNISHAADELGLSRGALYRRMERYGI